MFIPESTHYCYHRKHSVTVLEGKLYKQLDNK